jgi:hypothetical protein
MPTGAHLTHPFGSVRSRLRKGYATDNPQWDAPASVHVRTTIGGRSRSALGAARGECPEVVL